MIDRFLKRTEYPTRIHVIESRVKKYKFKNQKLDLITHHVSKTYYVRVIRDRTIGSAYCHSEEEIKEAYERAIKNSIPFNGNDFPEIETTKFEFYEDKLNDIEYSELGERLAMDMENILLQETYIEYHKQKHAIFDTHGNELVSRKNFVEVFSSATLENREISYGNTGHDVEYLVNDVKSSLEEKIRNTERFTKFSGKTDVVLFYEPSVAFVELVLDGFVGEEVEEKNVWTWNLFGKKIAPEITIEENPELPLCEKERFDDDGIPTSRKKLMDNGVLVAPVYDYYSAKKYGKEPTGNGFFVPENTHGVGFTNIEVSGKDIYEIENGVIAYEMLGFHTCNETTGDVKLVISLGALVRKGEVIGGVQNLGLSGNIKQFLEKMALTKEKKEYWKFYIPKLVLRDVSIV